MTRSPSTIGSHRFPHWELRPHERALYVRGQRAKIGSRAFDVLLALVERQGRVVSKGELIDAAWPGLVVEENNLSVQISALRKLLGADADRQRRGPGISARGRTRGAGRYDCAACPRAAGEALRARSELKRCSRSSASGPLVSIVGTGGVGKTALARTVVAASGRGGMTACTGSTWHRCATVCSLQPGGGQVAGHLRRRRRPALRRPHRALSPLASPDRARQLRALARRGRRLARAASAARAR